MQFGRKRTTKREKERNASCRYWLCRDIASSRAMNGNKQQRRPSHAMTVIHTGTVSTFSTALGKAWTNLPILMEERRYPLLNRAMAMLKAVVNQEIESVLVMAQRYEQHASFVFWPVRVVQKDKDEEIQAEMRRAKKNETQTKRSSFSLFVVLFIVSFLFCTVALDADLPISDQDQSKF